MKFERLPLSPSALRKRTRTSTIATNHAATRATQTHARWPGSHSSTDRTMPSPLPPNCHGPDSPQSRRGTSHDPAKIQPRARRQGLGPVSKGATRHD